MALASHGSISDSPLTGRRGRFASGLWCVDVISINGVFHAPCIV
jgi:hypothetical protein